MLYELEHLCTSEDIGGWILRTPCPSITEAGNDVVTKAEAYFLVFLL